MGKLDLKYSVKYLPYKLKGIQDYSMNIFILHSLDANNKAVWVSENNPEIKSQFDCLPILHPIADLTKEIEIDGVKITPVKYFGWINYSHITKDYDCTQLAYHYIEKLYEWHFDIDNLIPKGLAVDINKLANYKKITTKEP